MFPGFIRPSGSKAPLSSRNACTSRGPYMRSRYGLRARPSPCSLDIVPPNSNTRSKIAREIFDLVFEFGGTMSSEHGDGRARSPYLERMYGPRLVQAFRELKGAFDPEGRMNPGNIVASPGITEHLRYGAGYTTWEPATLLDFSAQGSHVV